MCTMLAQSMWLTDCVSGQFWSLIKLVCLSRSRIFSYTKHRESEHSHDKVLIGDSNLAMSLLAVVIVAMYCKGVSCQNDAC